MREKNNNERGFTMVETTIALVILMVALLGIASVFFYSTKYNSGASDRAIALVIAQQQMERLRNATFTDSELNATAPTTTTVTSAGRSYSVQLTIENTTTTRKTITIRVAPNTPSSAWSQSAVLLVAQRSALTIGPYVG